MRDAIIDCAITRSGYYEKESGLTTREHELAEAFRIEALGGADKALAIEKQTAEIEKTVNSWPEGLRDRVSLELFFEQIWINAAGQRRLLVYSEGGKITPYRPSFSGDHPLVQKLHDLDADSATLKAEAKSLRLQIRAVLDSVNTVKQPLDVWPEAKELIPEEVEQKIGLPAVQLGPLNAALGLDSK